ncbi:hypothetical protein FRB95_001466 [Tulasnella sp. JGI-2019a]|nr:hypothetical protein FRB95_001466 [Tulasnella sp. JGI-2019a]
MPMDCTRYCRITAYAKNITKTGFTLDICTWSNTIFYSAGATWIAYPGNRSNITSGAYDTKEIRAWGELQQRCEGDILFDKTFQKVPLVLTALNTLNFDKGTSIKVKTRCTKVTEKGMTWHIDNWDELIRYHACGSYLAIQDC